MQKVRWGVIGLGIGLQHAKELELLPDAELVAVCDRNPNALNRARHQLSESVAHNDELELLESAEIDAVVVASYDSQHAPAVIRALENGLHVFVEKPIATSRPDLIRIREALNRSRELYLSTNTLLRRSPRFTWLKTQILDGTFGDIFHIEGDYLYGRLAKLTEGWRASDPNYSVTLGGAIHVVDLVMWLACERPVRVSAIGSSKGSRSSARYETSHFLGDDFRMALLEFDSGLTAKVSANFACVMPHFHRFDVFGSEATFLNVPVPDGANRNSSSGLLFTSRDPNEGPAVVDLPYPAAPKGVLLGPFNQVILGKGDPIIPEQEAIDVMSVCLAVDESLRLGRSVDVVYEMVKPRQKWRDHSLGDQ